ncbi:MAG: DUF6508 domain-containing protein [Anaerolineaceae bacterium]|nr:MAG: hypothetical protein CVU45_00105 [Chloroflexi bacterium HGW-Chloroflexi-7]
MNDYTLPTKKDFQVLVDFLSIFSNPGFDPVLIQPEIEDTLQNNLEKKSVLYKTEVVDFFSLVSQEIWVDHNYIPASAQEFLENSEKVKTASFEEIRSLLTYCQRGERFCEGHWGVMIKNGKINQILVRLSQIAKIL